MKYLICALPFLLVYSLCLGQKISPEDLALADKLKEKFPDNKVASTLHESTYTFSYNKGVGRLEIQSDEKTQLIALTYGVKHVETNYFNDQVTINSYQIKNAKGRTITVDKFCGHYSSDGIFHSDAQVCGYNIPMAAKGVKRTFSTKQTYIDPKYLTSAYFHSSTPTTNRIISFKIPSWAEVELREMNFEGYSIKKKESQEKDMKVVSFEISDLEEFPKAANLPGSSYYMPHILVLTKSYTWSNTKYDILSSTESLYKWYKSLVDLSKFNPEALRALVDRVTAGSKSDEDKIKAIYYWVQDNIKYIAFEDGLAGFKPEDSDQVYAKKYGDCKGMANLTKDMLRIAGFDARLSWIGTDRIAYTYDMPSLAVDNHMICAVKLNDQFLFLDATEKHHSIKEYAERLQGKQVLIEDGDSFIIEQIPEEPMGKYLNTTNVSYSFNDESLNAEVVENIQGEYKRGLINIFEAVPNQKLNLFYKSIAAGNLETDDVNMLNEPALKRDSTLELHYNLNMKNHLNKFGNEVYLDLDYKKDLKNSEIEEDRKVPFKFSTKINRKLKGELVIPEGLAVSHLPEAYQVSSDYFEFNLSYEVIGNKINYTKELRVLKTYMPVDQFPDWNKAISNVTKFYNDQIILTSK